MAIIHLKKHTMPQKKLDIYKNIFQKKTKEDQMILPF